MLKVLKAALLTSSLMIVPASADTITGGQLILTPMLDFEGFDITTQGIGNTQVDAEGRIIFDIVGGQLDPNDLSTAVVDFAEDDGFFFLRQHTVGSVENEVTIDGAIVLQDFRIDAAAIEDLGVDFDGNDLGDSTGSLFNDATLVNVAVDATKLNGLDEANGVADPRVGRVTIIDDLSPAEQDLYINGSLDDGSAQADGRFLSVVEFPDNETFGLAVRQNGALDTANDQGLGGATLAQLQDSVNSPLFIELLPFFHTEINAQSTLGFNAADRVAANFVGNAALFQAHFENLTLAPGGSSGGAVPAPGGLVLLLAGFAAATRLRRKQA